MRLRVPQGTIDRMIAHARADEPNECCGLLLGVDEVVHDAVAARNIRSSATQYEIDPADHIAAIRRARASGQSVLGAYHSHPRGPSHPSERDAAEMSDPSMRHVIVSLASEPPVVGAFAWVDGNFVAIDLVPEP